MEYQTEVEFLEVKSPIDRFREQWTSQAASLAFLRQRKLLVQAPQLVQYAELARVKGWSQALLFGMQGLLISAFLISFICWTAGKDKGKEFDQIAAARAELDTETKRLEGVIAATQATLDRTTRSRATTGFTVGSSTNLSKDEALQHLNGVIEESHKSEQEFKARQEFRMQNLRAKGDGWALAGAATPVVFSLALLFAAQLARQGIQNDYGRFKLARQGGDHYLYYAVARGLWINCALVLALNLALRPDSFGLGNMFDAIGLPGRAIVWAGLYALLLYWFFLVSKDLYKSMQIQRPASYTGLENRILVRIHNSFWMVFAVFEVGLIALAYGVYLMERAG